MYENAPTKVLDITQRWPTIHVPPSGSSGTIAQAHQACAVSGRYAKTMPSLQATPPHTTVRSAVRAEWRAPSDPHASAPIQSELRALRQEVDTMLSQPHPQPQPQQSTPHASTSKPAKPWLVHRTPNTGKPSPAPSKPSPAPSKPRRTTKKQHPLYQYTPTTTAQQSAPVRRTRLAHSRPALSGGLQALFATPEPATTPRAPAATSSHAQPATSPRAPPLTLERTPMSPPAPRQSISTFIQQLPAVTPPSDSKGRRGKGLAAGLAAHVQVPRCDAC